MANKSPAFNFYSNDFDQATKFFTDDEVGKYIRLMITQHHHGHLTIEQMEIVCKGPVPAKVMAKYVTDDNGLYYNVRLDDVIHKKAAVVDQLKENLGEFAGKSRAEIAQIKRERKAAEEREKAEFPEKDGTEALSTQNAEDIPKEAAHPSGRFNPPSIEEVAEYCKERKNSVDPFEFVNFYESKGWMIGKNKMKDWKAAVHTWENKRKKEMIEKGVDRGQRPGQVIVTGNVKAEWRK